MNNNIKELMEFEEIYGTFHVIKNMNTKDRSWRLFPIFCKRELEFDNYIINHREVFPDEVVFDFDLNDRKKLMYYYNRISTRLKSAKIDFKSYTTGGKGIHIHCFFPELMGFDVQKRSLLKEYILDHFSKKDKPYAGLDYQLCYRHMIRAAHGFHEKTGKNKDLLHTYRKLIKGDNKIPLDAMRRLAKKKVTCSNKTFINNGYTFNCIDYLSGQDFANYEDGRKRALTLLASYYYGINPTEAENILSQWNDYKLNGYFNSYKITATINSAKKMHNSGRRYGCRAIQNLLNEISSASEVCESCPLYKGED